VRFVAGSVVRGMVSLYEQIRLPTSCALCKPFPISVSVRSICFNKTRSTTMTGRSVAFAIGVTLWLLGLFAFVTAVLVSV
jgi:hypothetical protein